MLNFRTAIHAGILSSMALVTAGCMDQNFSIKKSTPLTNAVATIAALPTPVSATPAPIAALPTPAACTETCAVSNGVGVQTCGDLGSCTLTQCNPGFVVDDGACIQVTSVTKFTCTSYELLNLDPSSNQLTTITGDPIPAQPVTGSGVCYYYPIIVESPPLSGASYLTGTAAQFHDQDVISRDHDAHSPSPTTDWHPYSMAHATLNFAVAGPRTLNITGGGLTGNTFSTADVQIDNFFLVGVYPQNSTLSTSNLQSFYSAWGTADSVVSLMSGNTATTGIAFNPSGINLVTNTTNTYPDGSLGYYSSSGLNTTSNYSVIPLNAEASWGTADVPEVSLSNLITPNVNMTIDFRALDCGASRAVGSIYLLVQ